MQLCKCGCGQEVNKRFIQGHNSRISNPMSGKKQSEEVKHKISEVMKQLIAEGKIVINRKPKLANVSKDELRDLYWDKHLTLKNIGKIYGVSSTPVMKKMKILGIPRRVHGFLKNVTREELIHLYDKQHLTTYDIAKIYKVDPSSIWERMRRLGITLRQSGIGRGCKRGIRGKGRHKTGQGYVRLLILDNNPYIAMARPDGYVLEHRLVMAQALGRCLLAQEIVHHKNGIKDDNRLENLELFPASGKHSVVNNTCKNCSLRKEIRLLHWQIKEQSEQIRNLSAKVMGVEL